MSVVTHIEHIVLDLDGTLIGEDHICTRPYLTEFLSFCFDHFESVNIWTAASQEWWIYCFNKYIRKCLPPAKNFHRVWFGDKCKRDGMCNRFKPLTKFYKRKWGMTRQNTVIVDNDPINYLYDQGNAIPIDTYLGSSQDDALLKLQNQLVAKNYYGLHIESEESKQCIELSDTE